jgi:hypothetical protein
MTKFLLAIVATLSLSANAAVITGTVGVGWSDTGSTREWVESYDAFTFSLLGDTSVTFDLGGSYSLYGGRTDGYLTLFEGVGVDPNAPYPNDLIDLNGSGTMNPVFRITKDFMPPDPLIVTDLAPGDYTLFVTAGRWAPGPFHIQRGWGYSILVPTFIDGELDNSVNGEVWYPGGYRLTVAGANLTKTGAQVPEPTIIALFGLGLVGIGFARRRQS